MTARFTSLLIATVLVLAAWSGAAEARRYSSMVVDARTGTVLHADQPDRWVYPASLTKIMTLYMVFEALERGDLALSTRLRTSRHAASMPPSELGLQAGDRIRVEDVVYALVTKSANDAAAVLAEAIGGSEAGFARMMTTRARQLGMRSTTFRNASGLPDGEQRTTARDMIRLGLRIQQDFPDWYRIFATERFRYGNRTYRNHNRLLASYAGTDGIKTGYIRASGFNLLASVERDGRRLVAVVFGGRSSKSRNAHMTRLLDEAFAKAEHRVPAWTLGPTPRRPAIAVAAVPPRQLAPERRPVDLRAASTRAAESAPLRVRIAPAGAVGAVYGVEVGAFATPGDAQRAAAAVSAVAPPLLADASIEVASITATDGTRYRARRMGLSPRAAATICRALTSVGQACDVVRRSGFDTRLVDPNAS